VYPSLEAILADEEVDLVINLTIHSAHVEVITTCLHVGKHVYSEKPMTLTSEEAWKLVALAEEKGCRLGSAPITILGEGQQTAWKVIRDGLLGTVRAAYAEVNWGRIESWHPTPGPFYEVGLLFDVAVYPLTLLTTIFGPARSVTAFGKVLYPAGHQRRSALPHYDARFLDRCDRVCQWSGGTPDDQLLCGLSEQATGDRVPW
jgi:predicted dehydrogenase